MIFRGCSLICSTFHFLCSTTRWVEKLILHGPGPLSAGISRAMPLCRAGEQNTAGKFLHTVNIHRYVIWFIQALSLFHHSLLLLL